MAQLKEIVLIVAPLAIVGFALLVMFEVINPSYRHVGWFVVAYLTLVLILLGRELLMDLWRWWQEGDER